ncbi:MAG: glycosyltransferase [Terriglobia bacterium]|jgi:glycosyltransferase involved in cell wall biosynthesis
MIPSYNRNPYLEGTLASVLEQDPGPEEMQIAVVDDASTRDDPEPLVRRLGGDRVTFIRQPRNLGQFANLNSCIQTAEGYWVHILHSDDLALPGFYATLKGALASRDDIGAAYCRSGTIGENGAWLRNSVSESSTPGILPGFLSRIAVTNRIQTPSIVVRRRVYEKLGGFRLDLPYAADWEMWIRIAAHYPIWYEPATLAAWRVHSESWSALNVRSGQNIADLRRCVEVSRSLLPAALAPALSRKAKDQVARVAVSGTFRALLARDLHTAFRQAREALRCDMSWRPVIRTLLFLPFRLVGEPLRRRRAAGRRQTARERGGIERTGCQ